MHNILRSLVIIACLCAAIEAKAQRPYYAKMSPLVREACLVATHERGQSAKGIRPNDRRSIIAFVKTDNDSHAKPEGCHILAKYGSLYIAEIPLGNLASLSLQPAVKRIEAGRGITATMDTTNLIVKARTLHAGIDLPKAYTGKGVVVGVQDIGFDLTHPTFLSPDTRRYRIKALWDQLATDTVGSTLPAGRDYRDSLSLLTLGHPRDGLAQTHGTHTAGIAAGSGSEGTPVTTGGNGKGFYSGVAPDADICLVCNATSDDADLISPDDYYKYTYALDALGFKYIFDYADSVGKPCVINFSEGSMQDLRGDDMLYYEMLDSLTGKGHIIVASAGNEGQKTNYLRKPKGIDSAEIYATSRWHATTMSFTTRSDSNFRLSILADGTGMAGSYDLSDITTAADSTYRDTIIIGGDSLAVTATAYRDCYDSQLTATDWVITSPNYIYPTILKLRMSGSDADVELYPSTALLGNDSHITGASAGTHHSSPNQPNSSTGDTQTRGDNTHSVLSPGSAPNVICVGMTGYRTSFTNYRDSLMDFGGSMNGEIHPASSIGPTFDGRTKPDVVAPGQNIVSAYSSFYIESNPNAGDINSNVRHFKHNGRTYAWNASGGTSMSAPVVTGVIALWLQANPRLTPQDCLDIMALTCTRHDTTMDYPNNTYGHGQIDAEAGLRLILEKNTGIKSAYGDKKDKRIYSIDGRLAGHDASRLKSGIYIMDGKKILIK